MQRATTGASPNSAQARINTLQSRSEYAFYEACEDRHHTTTPKLEDGTSRTEPNLGQRRIDCMRFTAEYDSEEEEYPVDDAGHENSPKSVIKTVAYEEWSSDDEGDEEVDFFDVSLHHSPRANQDAWQAMYNKDKEISRLNALNARSDDLEAVSVAEFLRQLSLDDEGRRKTEDEDLRKRNSEVLDVIGKAINATKARAEERRRKEEETERLRLAKIEEERRNEQMKEQEQERIRRERLLAAERARKAAEEKAAAEIAAKRQAEERKRQEEKEKEQKAAEKAVQKAAQKVVERTVVVPETPAAPGAANECEAEFNAHLAIIENIKSNVLKACSENPVWKKTCFELKRKITSRLGQLTNSRRQMSRLVRDLIETFDKGQSVSPTVLTWLLNFFSKQVIKQAESEVVVQIPSAYPLAFVCVYLMSKYPNLQEILLARFAKNSPWTIPFYQEPKTEEAMKRMGYKRIDDGKWEEPTRYIERQSGIFAVWIAMTTHFLNPKATDQESGGNPFPLKYAWRWAARTLNHPATNEIECAMMATFLEVANLRFVRTYRRQGQKIVNLAVGGQWVGEIRGPAVGRLEIMREEFQRTGRIGEEGFGAFVP